MSTRAARPLLRKRRPTAPAVAAAKLLRPPHGTRPSTRARRRPPGLTVRLGIGVRDPTTAARRPQTRRPRFILCVNGGTRLQPPAPPTRGPRRCCASCRRRPAKYGWVGCGGQRGTWRTATATTASAQGQGRVHERMWNARWRESGSRALASTPLGTPHWTAEAMLARLGHMLTQCPAPHRAARVRRELQTRCTRSPRPTGIRVRAPTLRCGLNRPAVASEPPHWRLVHLDAPWRRTCHLAAPPRCAAVIVTTRRRRTKCDV